MPPLRSCLATALFGWLGLAAGVATADFVNGGFESGDFSGWTVAGRTENSMVGHDGDEIVGEGSIFSPAVVNVRSGDYAAVAVVAATQGAGEHLALSQPVTFTDDLYEIGFYIGTDAAENFDVLQAIASGGLGIYVDGSPLPLHVAEHNLQGFVTPGSDPVDFRLFAARYEATAGTLPVELRVSGSGSSRAGISIDDAYALPVSELGSLTGDYNQDGVVDAADYTVWRDTLGQTGLTPGSGADGSEDGAVGPADYEVWRDNYGQAGAAPAARSAAAPEPASAALLCVATALVWRIGRRR